MSPIIREKQLGLLEKQLCRGVGLYCAHDSIAFKISQKPLWNLIWLPRRLLGISPVGNSESSLKIHREWGVAQSRKHIHKTWACSAQKGQWSPFSGRCETEPHSLSFTLSGLATHGCCRRFEPGLKAVTLTRNSMWVLSNYACQIWVHKYLPTPEALAMLTCLLSLICAS